MPPNSPVACQCHTPSRRPADHPASGSSSATLGKSYLSKLMSPLRPNRTSELAPLALVTGAADRLGAAIARDAWPAPAMPWSSTTAVQPTKPRDARRRKSSAAGGRAAALKADLANRAPARRPSSPRAAKPFGPLTRPRQQRLVASSRDSVADLDEALWDRAFRHPRRSPGLPRPRFRRAAARGRPGQHRQHHRRARAASVARLFQLHAEQGGALDHDADPGAVAGAAHPRQRHRPRPDAARQGPDRTPRSAARRPSAPLGHGADADDIADGAALSAQRAVGDRPDDRPRRRQASRLSRHARADAAEGRK